MTNETGQQGGKIWPLEERSAEALSFLKDLWGIAPKDWVAEFDFLIYKPTVESPDAKRMTAIFFTLDQVFTAWDGVFAELEKANRTQVSNVHHCCGPRFQKPKKGHGKNSDVSHLTCAWVDVDFNGQETIVRKLFSDSVEDLRKQDLGPTYIIESGHGLHGYWLFDQIYPVADARPIVCGLQDFFKIADAVNDPRRVLRLPGFINLKDPKHPAWCRVVEKNGKRFSILDFKDFVAEPRPTADEAEEAKTKAEVPITVSRDPKVEEAMKGVQEGGGPYGGRHQAAVAIAGHYCAKMKARKYVAYAMREWNQKNSPSLPDDEILKIVEDIWTKEMVKRAESPTATEKRQAEKEEAGKQRADTSPWLDEEGNFNPMVMAVYLARETKMLSTPIGRDGRGVELYRYENGVYRQSGNSFVLSEVRRLLGLSNRDKHMVEVLKLVTEMVKVEYPEINKKAMDLINVRNGLLDWRTGELKPHDPALSSLIQINAEYDPKASSPDLDKFLAKVLPEDAIPLVEEYIGYLLTPDTSLGKCLVAVGEGGNGKSTLLSLVGKMIGEENITHYSLHQISDDKFTAAGLVGKLANFYDELESRALDNTGVFKQLVSGDSIKAEEKNKAPFSFKPFARLVFATNQMPRTNDRSQGYFDRLLFVRFPNRFRETSGLILKYDEVLAAIPGLMSALLNRAVSGLKRLMAKGKFSVSKTNVDALEEYQRECNSAYDFLRENCSTEDPSGWISRSDFYDRYKAWAVDTGRKPMSQRELAKTLRTANVREVRHGDGRGWGNVSWTAGRPPETSKSVVDDFYKGEGASSRGQGHLDF